MLNGTNNSHDLFPGIPRPPSNRSFEAPGKKLTSDKTPFSPTIKVSRLKASVPFFDKSSEIAKVQEQVQSNAQKMVQSVVDQNHTPKEHLDQSFVCDPQTFNETYAVIKELLNEGALFDVGAYLQGKKGRAGNNPILLEKTTVTMRNQAKLLVESGLVKDLREAYKKLVGAIDEHDLMNQEEWKKSKMTPPSSYLLRTALLKASHEEGVGLDTWCVYTKRGKPTSNHIWTFLENGKNWIPEAQGSRAKWIESTAVKTKALSASHCTNRAVFLKGGFGAGKTRLINQLFGDTSGGAIAPDLAKAIDRRATPALPHSAAHVHGSQAAYELMDEMVQKQKGTVVYDSSLKNPSDIAKYLADCKKAGKQLEIYDVARNDMARALAVLKRSVDGEDPRIPPDSIIFSAVTDKMKRVECMQVILNDVTSNPEKAPLYHFISGDRQGWNTEEVMVLSSQGKIMLSPGAQERLALEGIEYDESTQSLRSTLDREKLNQFYKEQFDRPVREIRAELSTDEQKALDIFAQRRFALDRSKVPITDAATLYRSLSKGIQDVISQNAFESAFDSVETSSRDAFFASLSTKDEFTYEDLPLKAALSIHANLKKDPWT